MISYKACLLLLAATPWVGALTIENSNEKFFRRDDERAAAIKEAYVHSWEGYVKYAWGHDELQPVTNGTSDPRNGWGASIVDGLSTAILMELSDVVVQQLQFIAQIDFTQTKTTDTVSLFETTIRYLGGLLSGYDLLKGPYSCLLDSKYDSSVDALLTQAKSLADALSFAFNTTTGVPANNLDFTTSSSTDTSNGLATTGTLILEWTRLSDLTGDSKYANLASKAEQYLLYPSPSTSEPFPGLVGTNIDISTGKFLDNYGGWNGGDDSFYEYLIKMYAYDPARFPVYKDRWIAAADSTIKYLTQHPSTRPDITFVAGFQGTSLSESMGHLTCFIGGNFILGGEVLNTPEYTEYGLNLTAGCHDTYNSTATGIGPEGFSWDTSSIPTTQSTFYDEHGFYITTDGYYLRPEVVESYYYAYKSTGDEQYREWAWEAFQGINAACRTASGYSSISEVNVVGGGQQTNSQESFWFAEVLKYLYIIFEDSTKIGVTKGQQKWIFNTEAHPVRAVGSV
ncbi:hypothetical protein RUND412_008993 [Rhizina undulata]